jgi:hypothetical protein
LNLSSLNQSEHFFSYLLGKVTKAESAEKKILISVQNLTDVLEYLLKRNYVFLSLGTGGGK